MPPLDGPFLIYYATPPRTFHTASYYSHHLLALTRSPHGDHDGDVRHPGLASRSILRGHGNGRHLVGTRQLTQSTSSNYRCGPRLVLQRRKAAKTVDITGEAWAGEPCQNRATLWLFIGACIGDSSRENNSRIESLRPSAEKVNVKQSSRSHSSLCATTRHRRRNEAQSTP